jgi:hypothetical protein
MPRYAIITALFAALLAVIVAALSEAPANL